MTESKFFVLGSMSSGAVQMNRFLEFISASRQARAKGSAYRLQAGFPVFSQLGEDLVDGLVITIKDHDLVMNLMDHFHGYDRFQPEKSLHLKIEIEIETEAGTEKVFAYVINPLKMPKSAKLIESGDWQRSMQENPPMSVGLSEKQKAYIQRLGSTSGREIIPIDLNLYRELMKLELIVDKGRRLALSKLGNEVFRYLG